MGEDNINEVEFDGDNSFVACRCCGHCCELNMLAVTSEEIATMRAYVAEHNIQPKDNKQRCCFQADDRHCLIWEARPQVCKLHNCEVPRKELLAMNSAIKVPDDMYLIDLNECFLHNGFETYAEHQPILQ